MTGYYPVGSVVILDSYELAVVCAPSSKPESFNQPVVRVIYDVYGVGLVDRLDLGLPLAVVASATILWGSVRALQEAVNRRDWPAVETLLAPGFVQHGPTDNRAPVSRAATPAPLPHGHRAGRWDRRHGRSARRRSRG